MLKYLKLKYSKSTTLIVMSLLLILLMIMAAPAIQKNKLDRLSGKGQQKGDRNISLGHLLPATDAYTLSPFLVDYMLGEKSYEQHILFRRINSGSTISFPSHTENQRLFLSKPGTVTLVYKVSGILKRAPRIFIYNDHYQLIKSVILSELNKKTQEYKVDFLLDPGLYKIKQSFSSEDLESIILHYSIQSHSQGIAYKDYLETNIKDIHIRVLPVQLAKLNEMQEVRKFNWRSLPAGDWSKRFLPSPSETIQAHTRSKHGAWNLAEISLSGRNEQHLADTMLPSLDVNIRAGELPYGLKKFKLYTLSSKTHGLDMLLEQLIGDQGVPANREDIVKVFLNENFVGYMQLWEGIDTHFFEYNQIAEGPVLGYDTDALIANPGHSWFSPRSYYKPKINIMSEQEDVASGRVSKMACDEAINQTIAFGLFYSGLHGLGSVYPVRAYGTFEGLILRETSVKFNVI